MTSDFVETISRLKTESAEFSVFSNHNGRLEVRVRRGDAFESIYFNEDSGDYIITEWWL